MNSLSLEGQVALVTGASRGIGQSVALELARHGATVMGTATTASGAQAYETALSSAGLSKHGRGMVVDVSSSASVDMLFAKLGETDQMPAILVNNAGIARDTLLARMSEEDWQAVLDTNLSSLFRTTKACCRHFMKARCGRIINIGSVVGSLGNAGQAGYAAAKAGLIGFTRSMARELGPRGITVNAIAPGFIDTDMTRALNEKQRADTLSQIPLRRLGTSAEVAAAVVFLASPAAAYITGETLHVNGGMYMG